MNDPQPNGSRGKRVLVVDDDDLILRLVCRQLRSEGFDVASAQHGHAAVDWCDENGCPDLLLTDVCMPGIDGPALHQRLSDRFSDVPVLFMSATAWDEQDRVIAPLLRKPFRREELISMISASLDGGALDPNIDRLP